MTGFNKQQLQAIQICNKPVMVIAGAGSGKTSVITGKILHLAINVALPIRNIYAISFTNKAANEMLHRISYQLKKQGFIHNNKPVITTFHSIGLKIIKSILKLKGSINYQDYQNQNPNLFYLRSNFSIIDSNDNAKIIKDIIQNLKIYQGDNKLINDYMNVFSFIKYNLLDIENDINFNSKEKLQQKINSLESNIAFDDLRQAFFDYQNYLKNCNLLDFDDLLYLPWRWLNNSLDLKTMWQSKVDYLLVDEYQDTNILQYALIKTLVGSKNNLTVVGDDDQSIYGWRGADQSNLEILETDFPELTIIKLEQNYRSCNNILKLANSLIKNNQGKYKKTLWSNLGEGVKTKVVAFKDEYIEAEQVIKSLVHNKISKGNNFYNYAILYRSNHQARLFERVLIERNLPYKISGGMSFFDRQEIKDFLSYLKLIANPDDNNSFLRVINLPKRGLGVETIKKLATFANEFHLSFMAVLKYQEFYNRLGKGNNSKNFQKFYKNITEFRENMPNGTDLIPRIKEFMDDVGFIDNFFNEFKDSGQAHKKVQRIDEIYTWIDRLVARELEKNNKNLDFSEMVHYFTLQDIIDNEDSKSYNDKISLMTLHAAKGLEFAHVYLIGFEDGILPHYKNLHGASLEEERRLAYVAITRAKKELNISWAKTRHTAKKEIQKNQISKFFGELPKNLLLEGMEQSFEDMQEIVVSNKNPQEMLKEYVSQLEKQKVQEV